MSLVLDGSAMLAIFLDDERPPVTAGLLHRLRSDGCVVPSLWWLETANGLLVAERRRRFTREARLETLVDVASLPIETDPHTNDHALATTSRLAEQHGLSVYDAAYLELAIRRALPLATLDRRLAAAAERAAITLLL